MDVSHPEFGYESGVELKVLGVAYNLDDGSTALNKFSKDVVVARARAIGCLRGPLYRPSASCAGPLAVASPKMEEHHPH